jgi:hypothetical protein
MVKSLSAFAAVPFLLAALAGPALAVGPMVGVSVGGGLSGPPQNANGTVNTNVQWNSGVYFRAEPAGQYSEASIGIFTRAQALSQARDSVFDTSGLQLSVGAKAGFLHLGVDGELSALHSIVQDATAPGTLMFHNGAGIVVEPYVGLSLPFFKSEFTDLELSFHYPVFKLLEDSIGPRLQLTLWVGTPDKGMTDDKDDSDTPDNKPDGVTTPDDKPDSSNEDGGTKADDSSKEAKPDAKEGKPDSKKSVPKPKPKP